MLRLRPDEVRLIEWLYDRAVANTAPFRIGDLDGFGREHPLVLCRQTKDRLRQELDQLLEMIGKPTINPDECDSEQIMDADTRHMMITWRRLLALDEADQELVLPWYYLKEIVAQILHYEVWQEEVKCRMEGRELSESQQHKRLAAEQILKEAKIEKQAFIDKALGKPENPVIEVPKMDVPGFDV